MVRIGCRHRTHRPLWSFTGAELWTQRLLLDAQVPRRDRIRGRWLALAMGIAGGVLLVVFVTPGA